MNDTVYDPENPLHATIMEGLMLGLPEDQLTTYAQEAQEMVTEIVQAVRGEAVTDEDNAEKIRAKFLVGRLRMAFTLGEL